MIREIGVIVCMLIAFAAVEFFTDAPMWVSLIVALISGMWADLRMAR